MQKGEESCLPAQFPTKGYSQQVNTVGKLCGLSECTDNNLKTITVKQPVISLKWSPYITLVGKK